MGESSLFDFSGDFLELVVLRDLLGHDGQPSEPLAFVGVGPKRRVLGPETLHLVIFFPVFDVGSNGLGKIIRQLIAERIHYFFTAEAEAAWGSPVCFATAASKVSKALANCFTPSSVSLSVAAFIEIPAFSSPCMVSCAP